jgi:FMN reductase
VRSLPSALLLEQHLKRSGCVILHKTMRSSAADSGMLAARATSMSRLNAVAVTGSMTRSSRCTGLARVMLSALEAEHAFQSQLFELAELARPVGQALHREEASAELERTLTAVENADVLVLVTPLRRGSFPGLFKHFLDLLNPDTMRHVPVIVGATGTHEAQRLLAERALLPVLAAFGADVVHAPLFVAKQSLTPSLPDQARAVARRAVAALLPAAGGQRLDHARPS